ncbi:DUF6924 domain-containing protein [Nonomuraea lactucae]|uniref:DUF6924 domain-containing protein n=1 Tax=Nonomuraea lactucae TaxID=2249762 RepID=UPI000DE407A8
MLPEAQALLVLRTDFSDQEAWEAVRAALGVPDGDGRTEDGSDDFAELYMDEVSVLDDLAYRDLTVPQVLDLVPDGYADRILVVVDRAAIDSAEMPVLLIDLVEEPGRTMRVVPAELPAIHANLSIANMDFFEFADSADEDGVFRGFPD